MKIHLCEQLSPEWHRLKLGKVSATRITNMLGNGKGHADLVSDLAYEQMYGQPRRERFETEAMRNGTLLEPEARIAYMEETETYVQEVGFVEMNEQVGCSPDGLVGKFGGIEIKCPLPTTHQTYEKYIHKCNRLPSAYVNQVQGCMWVTDRMWWDFVSYCPGGPLLIIRVHRDDQKIREFEAALEPLIDEVNLAKERLVMPEEKVEIDVSEGLAVFDPIKAEMEKYKAENASIFFDYEDPEDNKLARSHVFKLRKVKGRIAATHKILKADALVFCKKVDSEKRDLTADIEEMIAVHAEPIKAIDNQAKIEAEAKAEAERLEAERLEFERLEAIRIQEEKAAAEAEKLRREREELEREKEKLAAAKQAELDAQQRVKEERERAEADRKEAAERAEREKAEALARAEREKQEAIEAEKEKARQAKAAEEAEKARLAEIERVRIADETHRKAVETAITEKLYGFIDDAPLVDELVRAISNGEIENLTITY